MHRLSQVSLSQEEYRQILRIEKVELFISVDDPVLLWSGLFQSLIG
jgi:hypothetical protein